jgi:hypothetical protein
MPRDLVQDQPLGAGRDGRGRCSWIASAEFGSSHFIADERLEAVVDLALEFFAGRSD